MGNRCSRKQRYKTDMPKYGGPWIQLYAGNVNKWSRIAGQYGFQDQPYRCQDVSCDRESVCLKFMKAQLHKCQLAIEIHRYKKSSVMIPFGGIPNIRSKSKCDFILCPNICAKRHDLVLLLLFKWDNLNYETTFICVDSSRKTIHGCFDAEPRNMSVIQCEFSPDNSIVAVIFYHRSEETNQFQYDLFIYSLQSLKCTDQICLNKEVRPYITFDPRYRYSRLSIINYAKKDSPAAQLEKSLVTYCVDKHEVVCSSKVNLPFIFGNSCFSLVYSPDGRYIIVQKISDNHHGINGDTDTYIFCSDTLRLLWHHFTNLPSFSSYCSINYLPTFSKCSSRICILDEKVDGKKTSLSVAVFQLPRPTNLQQLCRIAILECLPNKEKVEKLPLPRSLKGFLAFKPLF